MNELDAYRPLTDKQVELLKVQGCTAEDWSTVFGTIDFVVDHLHEVHFAGVVRLGRLTGRVTDDRGMSKAAGVYDAYLANCSVGDGARIANVRSHISNYAIGAHAWIEDVGVIEASPQAAFGNGVTVNALNEAGGRAAVMFNELSSQFAFLQVVCRARPELTRRLQEIAAAAAAQAAAAHGVIGAGAMVHSVGRMVDVAIGDGAVVRGAASLENGTVLSAEDAPTAIGAGVAARDFIVAEGSIVDDGAILNATYVGQGCRVGKQFSAENSLFFANCEAFHGEAVSVFAGPYTVTHHKSTLLIAGMFSFYNAGSGTNQSNHMYKLGPVHEGKLERGCKTGSFSYMMWPCRVGPFSVVLGKHTRTFDLGDFPFSHVEGEERRPHGSRARVVHQHGGHAPRRRQVAFSRSPQGRRAPRPDPFSGVQPADGRADAARNREARKAGGKHPAHQQDRHGGWSGDQADAAPYGGEVLSCRFGDVFVGTVGLAH